MRIAIFCHSLVSDWNHGNAHFLRGVALELIARDHDVKIYEPRNGWSRSNLERDAGPGAINDFHDAFPELRSIQYDWSDFCMDSELDEVDAVLVHEWNDPELIAAVGNARKRNSALRTFFHDTHHRAVTAPHELARFDLTHYDAVLAYGESLKHAYLRRGWAKQVYVWHEAADVRTFYPHPKAKEMSDLVWIGNWGDEERTRELREYFVEPVANNHWKADVFGVRYPEPAIRELDATGIRYRGWVANFRAPEIFSQFKATVHVPRGPYSRDLPGIPTIRPFEALACGIPLVSAPWQDREQLFRLGRDFLMASTPDDMEQSLRAVLNDEDLRESLAASGLETIRNRHTCGHRVDQLLEIYKVIAPVTARQDLEMPAGVIE
jgi:spore maturation protein CgeB